MGLPKHRAGALAESRLSSTDCFARCAGSRRLKEHIQGAYNVYQGCKYLPHLSSSDAGNI